MRYHGFATRDYLVLERLPLDKDVSVMEIGLGTGSTAAKIIGKVKKFCGVDISEETIAQLSSIYEGDDSVSFHNIDVCKNADLGKKFEVVFSADTLEHVEAAEGFLNFISRHLSPEGMALVTFPNESEKRHHGVTWFNQKKDLVGLIERSGLLIEHIFQVRKTLFHRFAENLLWKLPKATLKRRSDVGLAHSFEKTTAFSINSAGGVKANIFALYARFATGFAALFRLYDFVEVGEDISDRVLMLHIKHRFAQNGNEFHHLESRPGSPAVKLIKGNPI